MMQYSSAALGQCCPPVRRSQSRQRSDMVWSAFQPGCSVMPRESSLQHEDGLNGRFINHDCMAEQASFQH